MLSTTNPRELLATIDLPGVGPRLVGVVLLVAAIAKALAPRTFHDHLARLGWRHEPSLRSAVMIVAASEAGIGSALIIGLATGASLPLIALGIALLTAVSYWGVREGRISDCGCYGGFFRPSITQSVSLNALYVLVLLYGWLADDQSGLVTGRKLYPAVAMAAMVALSTTLVQRFEASSGRLLFETNRLKAGARWRRRWSAGAVDRTSDEMLVSYLGPDCPHCQRWVRVLNVIHASAALPGVVGVVAVPDSKRLKFVAATGIRFPTVRIPSRLMDRLVEGVPTTVLVKDGKIAERWVGQMAPTFLARLNQTFFPEAERARGGTSLPTASGALHDYDREDEPNDARTR